MNVTLRTGNPFNVRTDMLCFLIDAKTTFERTAEELESWLAETDVRGDRVIDWFAGRMPEMGDLFYSNTLGTMPAGTVLFAGIGGGPHVNSYRIMAGRIALEARRMGLANFAVFVPGEVPIGIPGGKLGGKPGAIRQIVEGAKLSLYSFDLYASKKKRPSPDLLVVAEDSPENSNALQAAEIMADGVNYARDVANMPPNECPPSTLADIGSSLAQKHGFEFRSLTKSDLKRLGFGGISAVGGGSANEPLLFAMEYRGGGVEPPTALVGKAVTFDTGGISIKPSQGMDKMKFDKCGGCVVMAVMSAAAKLKLPLNLVGVVPSVENMPGSCSYRPGDIIRLYNGKTVEVVNTDAEGRLILADAIAYAKETYSPSSIIDVATLTDACVVALGTDIAGMVGNDDVMYYRMMQAAKVTAEPVWRLPLGDGHREMIKSEVADMKNLGPGNAAQTIVAAAFLSNSVGDTPWVHLDVAGTSWTSRSAADPYRPEGATGFGVRLILEYLSQPPDLVSALQKYVEKMNEVADTVRGLPPR